MREILLNLFNYSQGVKKSISLFFSSSSLHVIYFFESYEITGNLSVVVKCAG